MVMMDVLSEYCGSLLVRRQQHLLDQNERGMVGWNVDELEGKDILLEMDGFGVSSS